ncbi:uncharacterized protein LOC128931906 [Callithrix jacchus]|uniref:tRNA (guanine-N(7)-)-methyltransferase-like n=1 Tax=Callithrix jacchus TaxID=9483 RepID=UPI0023DD2EB8|nr:tRNA (guanine-N(7)-)-methyltransferase-like [Callithrix jacchus]
MLSPAWPCALYRAVSSPRAGAGARGAAGDPPSAAAGLRRKRDLIQMCPSLLGDVCDPAPAPPGANVSRGDAGALFTKPEKSRGEKGAPPASRCHHSSKTRLLGRTPAVWLLRGFTAHRPAGLRRFQTEDERTRSSPLPPSARLPAPARSRRPSQPRLPRARFAARHLAAVHPPSPKPSRRLPESRIRSRRASWSGDLFWETGTAATPFRAAGDPAPAPHLRLHPLPVHCTSPL